jgi:phosphonate transport system substrate-binding protein
MTAKKQTRGWIVVVLVAVLGIGFYMGGRLAISDLTANGELRSTEPVDPAVLVLGFLPSARADEILPDAERLGAFLSERLGRPVEVQVPTAYAPLIEGFRFGHIHAAFLDSGAGWIAHRRTGAEVILAEVKDGATFYYADAFVRDDSPLGSIEESLGKRLAITSRTGSSGFLMPIGSMIAAGLIEPKGTELVDLEAALAGSFAATIEAGGYQQALQAVLDGRVDLAFGAHDAPERFLTPEQRSRIRMLHRFGKSPSHAVMVAGNLAPAVTASLREALLALNEPENLPLLRAIYGVDGLEAADTEDHLGEFGRALSAIPGMERSLLERKGK